MPAAEIQVVVKRPNETPFKTNIDLSQNGLHKAVGGYFELVRLGPYDLYCNENGKEQGLAPNIRLPNDIIVGTVVLSKSNEEGDQVSLTDVEAETGIMLLKQLAFLGVTMPTPKGEN